MACSRSLQLFSCCTNTRESLHTCEFTASTRLVAHMFIACHMQVNPLLHAWICYLACDLYCISWISRAYECRLCNCCPCQDLYRLWEACPCMPWSTIAMRALTWVVFVPRASFTPMLRSGSSLYRRMHKSMFSLHGIFKFSHLKFTVYGHKQTDRHTHKFRKCSPSSVGLTQARPK